MKFSGYYPRKTNGKWFLAIMLMLNAKKGLSALQLSRDLDVNKNTAWRIFHADSQSKMIGDVVRKIAAERQEIQNGMLRLRQQE